MFRSSHSVSLSFHRFLSLSSSFFFHKFLLRASVRGICSTAVSHELELEEPGNSSTSQPYLWLLERCVNSGTSIDSRKLHCSVLKSGFDAELLVCDRLINNYIAFRDFDSAAKVFDEIPERSLSCWNKIIHVFVANNLVGHVLGRLYRKMIWDNVDPDGNTLAAIWRCCSSVNVGLGCVNQIHARIVIHGFDTSPLVGNLMIDLFLKRGYVDSARKIFGNLSLRDSISWVAMISGLSQNRREEEAISLFCQANESRIVATPYIFSSVLSACTKVELFGVGFQIHSLAFKIGFSSETHVCNALMALYSRSGNFISAGEIFGAMRNRDQVSYNSLISGLAQRGFSDRALELFEEMQLDCSKPDCVTVASVLSACTSVGALSKGTQLHSYVTKAGMLSDIILEGSLLDLYVKCLDLDSARKFFLMTKRDNVVLWNVMLVAYGQSDNLDESFQIFRQMQIEGIVPNEFTYPSILRTCTATGEVDLGEQIHAQATKTGFQHNVYVSSVLIDMYAKHGKLDVGLRILRRLSGADVVCWTSMVAGHTQHDLYSEAINLFQEMENRGIRADSIGFASAITACAGIKALDRGRQLHARSCISGYSNDHSIGNALVSLYSKCGRISEAYSVFEKNDAKDNVSWNSLISGFAQSGHFEEALQVYSKMNRIGVKANLFTFGSAASAAANLANIKQGQQIHALVLKSGCDSETEASNVLITLYAKCGRINDAKRTFYEMSEKNEVSWNAMIMACSQHGFGYEVLWLFENMKQIGLAPSHVTFIGVLSACSHVGLVKEGLAYFESMNKEHGLVPKTEHCVCVVDLFGRAGRLSEAKEFIENKMTTKPNAMIWRTLLSACTVHKDIEIGEFAARNLLALEPRDSATYVLLANMYAVTGKWEFRDEIRKLMKERGVKKEPGLSWIEVNNAFHAFFVGDQVHSEAEKIHLFLADLNKRAAEIGYVQERYRLLNDEEQELGHPSAYTHSEKLAIAFGVMSVADDSRPPIHVIKNLRVCKDCHNWIKYVSVVVNRAIVVRDAYRFHHFDGGVCSCRDYW